MKIRQDLLAALTAKAIKFAVDESVCNGPTRPDPARVQTSSGQPRSQVPLGRTRSLNAECRKLPKFGVREIVITFLSGDPGTHWINPPRKQAR